jgi:hypothetical protein
LNFGCKKSRFILFLVYDRGAAIGLLLRVDVSSIGICSSLAICARMSFLSGTCDIVGPVGISISGDAYCCVVSCCGVIAAGVLFGIIAVDDGILEIGNSLIESESVVAGGCRIGPFLIQYKISVTDDMCSASVDLWQKRKV